MNVPRGTYYGSRYDVRPRTVRREVTLQTTVQCVVRQKRHHTHTVTDVRREDVMCVPRATLDRRLSRGIPRWGLHKATRPCPSAPSPLPLPPRRHAMGLTWMLGCWGRRRALSEWRRRWPLAVCRRRQDARAFPRRTLAELDLAASASGAWLAMMAAHVSFRIQTPRRARCGGSGGWL